MPKKARPTPPKWLPQAQVEKDESKRDRFERIAKARMNKALTAIRLLGNLSSPNYEWTQNDVRAISDTLQFAVNETLAKFRRREKSPPLQFSFPEEGETQKTGNSRAPA